MFKIWMALFIAFAIYSYEIYTTKKIEHLAPNKQVLAGWHTWQASNCQSCHQIYGLGGYLGPDLTNVASASGKGDLYLYAFIKNGTDKMPCFHLQDSTVNDLIAFLKWVDKSGKNKVDGRNVTWTGNYDLENE